MAVKLRLQRAGGKKDAFYRVVVSNSRSPRDGRFIEQIGIYDPMEEPARVKLNQERLEHWLKAGAQPTETVLEILRRQKKEAQKGAAA